MTKPEHETSVAASMAPWTTGFDYTVDAWQRSILFLDVLRQRGNQYLEHMAEQAPHVLQLPGRARAGRPQAAAAGELRAGPDHPAARRHDRCEEAAVRRRRPARRARAGDRRLQGRQRDRRRDAGRPSLLLRRLPARAGAGPDDRGHHGCRGRVPRAGDRAASRRRRQAGGDRQLPGRLGHDAGGRDPARAVRPDDHRGRALVLLGRRAWPEPDALFGWPQSAAAG